MIDHIGITSSDLTRSRAFYERALAPLGYTVFKAFEGQAVGFCVDNKPDFWIGAGPDPRPTHVAFRAKGRAQVKAFYDAALAAGGKDNGAPGVRAHYHPDYYAAFVTDPDGHNIEAVCHEAYLG